MPHVATYRVIGTRDDGQRIVLSEHHTEEDAERLLLLLKYGVGYQRFHVETDAPGQATQQRPHPP